MNKKKNLLNIFTQDSSYNYHLVKVSEPDGHLVYLIKNGSKLDIETLEFSPTRIMEDLIKECSVKIEKFAPAIFFTEEENTEKLKYELNNKLSEDSDFSAFIETIKEEYRKLEVKDSLLYKKDPKAYDEAKQKEHNEQQKELLDGMVKDLTERKEKREEMILAYNNDLIKLLKEYLEDVIEFEKKDFKFESELEKVISNLIDPETWIKINDKPFICRVEVCSLEQDKMNVFLTDNNDYSYTATLKFDKTILVTENAIRINKGDKLPKLMNDYEVLNQLYDIDIKSIADWDFKNDSERFEYVIDFLVPIFKKNKSEKKKKFLEKILKEQELESNDDDNNIKILTPDKYMFNVIIPDDINEMSPPAICLVEIEFWNKNGFLNDSLGSHNLSKGVKKSLINAGVYGLAELTESVWEVVDYNRTKQDIIDSMVKEGFIYNQNI